MNDLEKFRRVVDKQGLKYDLFGSLADEHVIRIHLKNSFLQLYFDIKKDFKSIKIIDYT